MTARSYCPITCEWCLTNTRRAPRAGRRTYRHKCPHGVWCPRADKLRQHDNHYPLAGGCDECRADWAYRAKLIRARVARGETYTDALVAVLRERTHDDR